MQQGLNATIKRVNQNINRPKRVHAKNYICVAVNMLTLLIFRFSIFSLLLFLPAEFSDLLPDDMIPKNYLNFRHVVPVSASTGFGIEHLKSCIRESLDEDAEMATKAIHQERLQALRHQ